MNKPENSNTERRLQELELELERSGESAKKTTKLKTSSNSANFFELALGWFEKLPTAGKAGVAVLAIIVGFSLLNSVLKLAFSLLVIAIFSVVLYGAYKIFLK